MRDIIIVVLLLAAAWLLSPSKSPDERSAQAPPPEVMPGPPSGDTSGIPAPTQAEEAFPDIEAVRQPEGGSTAYGNGVAALEGGRFDEAITWLEDALKGGVRAADVPLAVALWKDGRIDDAVRVIRNAVVERPDDPDAWMVMGEVMEAAGDLQAAVDAWEHLRTIRPDPALADRIRRARADLRVRDKWRSQVSRHFSVFFEGPVASRVAHEALDALEDAYRDVGGVLRYYPRQPVEAVLYTNETFYDVTRSPAWSGGIFDGRVRLPVSGAESDPAALRRVATHEYVHAALRGMAGDRSVPTWLHEGLAMNLESAQPPYAGERDLLMDSDTTPLTLEALSGPFIDMDDDQVLVAYAQSFVLVNSLLARFGHYKLRDLVNGITSGNETLETAFQRIYRETPERAMERALADLKTREESPWRRS